MVQPGDLELRSIRAWAAILGVRRQALRAAIERGELPAYRISQRTVLIRRSALDTWLENHRIDGLPRETHEGA